MRGGEDGNARRTEQLLEDQTGRNERRHDKGDLDLPGAQPRRRIGERVLDRVDAEVGVVLPECRHDLRCELDLRTDDESNAQSLASATRSSPRLFDSRASRPIVSALNASPQESVMPPGPQNRSAPPRSSR